MHDHDLPTTENVVSENNTLKRKISYDHIISKAKKLPKITISHAIKNITEKTVITKYMFDQINKYDNIIDIKIGKKTKRNYSNLSKFGKPQKTLNFVVEKRFEHILCPLFKSGFLDFPSVQSLCSVHKLFIRYYLSMYRSLNINFTPLWDKNPN